MDAAQLRANLIRGLRSLPQATLHYNRRVVQYQCRQIGTSGSRQGFWSGIFNGGRIGVQPGKDESPQIHRTQPQNEDLPQTHAQNQKYTHNQIRKTKSRKAKTQKDKLSQGQPQKAKFPLAPESNLKVRFSHVKKQQHGSSAKEVLREVPSSPFKAEFQMRGGRSFENEYYIKTDRWKYFNPVLLRDSCVCPKCVDPSTQQKNFQSTDIPENIIAKDARVLKDGTIEIIWENDIKGFGESHITKLPKDFFYLHNSRHKIALDRHGLRSPITWDRECIRRNLEYVNYEEYMTTDEALFTALRQLIEYGLLLVRKVPDSEQAVENIASRIGTLRDSFYGRTWDVKSVPEAKNVAYTDQSLGLHMDLLYMANPPGIQLLHCLRNTCEGGLSLFSDTFKAASKLDRCDFQRLSAGTVAYHYRNAGEHYYYQHPVLENYPELGVLTPITTVNYSPPFQAPFPHSKQGPEEGGGPKKVFIEWLRSFKNFAREVESDQNLFEYRLQVGECVIFNNRRVLHGRRQFDANHGERWLKGAYVDSDVFRSRYNVLREKWEIGELVMDGSKKLLVNPEVITDTPTDFPPDFHPDERRIKDKQRIKDEQRISAFG
jgi:gamma-butyrobetaine dioxygenase